MASTAYVMAPPIQVNLFNGKYEAQKLDELRGNRLSNEREMHASNDRVALGSHSKSNLRGPFGML